MKPIVTAADKSVLDTGGLSVSVLLTSELVEPFMQKLQEISELVVKHRFVYVYI